MIVELRLPMRDPRVNNSSLITLYVTEQLAKRGLDIMMNDVIEIVDDYDRMERIMKVKTRTTTVHI